MAEPFMTAARLGLVGLVVLRVVLVVRRRRSTGPADVVRLEDRRRVTDTSIVSAYNDALLTGWPAGETATFEAVAEQVGTSADHVRTVIARHWAM
jgi:hypothetical protein